MDIPEFFVMVEELFDPEEAEINNALPRKPASIDEIAAKIGRSFDEVSEILERMAGRGLCGVSKASDGVRYRGLPFMPGIFEFIFIGGGESERKKTAARLIHAYKKAYSEARGVEKISYPLTRVIPVARTIRACNTIKKQCSGVNMDELRSSELKMFNGASSERPGHDPHRCRAFSGFRCL